MTQYDATMPGVQVAFRPQSLTNTFGEYISDKGLTQLRIAETEKYAHVTFFFNGGVEKEYPGEDRVLINSPKVATYDMQPEMSANKVCDAVVEKIRSGAYDVIILNYANCDMVGHTGVFDAAKAAVEAVDACVGRRPHWPWAAPPSSPPITATPTKCMSRTVLPSRPTPRSPCPSA